MTAAVDEGPKKSKQFVTAQRFTKIAGRQGWNVETVGDPWDCNDELYEELRNREHIYEHGLLFRIAESLEKIEERLLDVTIPTMLVAAEFEQQWRARQWFVFDRALKNKALKHGEIPRLVEERWRESARREIERGWQHGQKYVSSLKYDSYFRMDRPPKTAKKSVEQYEAWKKKRVRKCPSQKPSESNVESTSEPQTPPP